ncbi:MAG TPA: hypothetical protein VIM79_05760 [Niastella sp.]
MMRLLNYILFLLIAFTSSKAFAQSKDLVSQENKLINYHIEVDTRLERSRKIPYDSLQYKNDSVELFVTKLETEFIQLITGNPKTLDYLFKRLQDSGLCHTSTSADGNFRIYDLYGWLLRTQIYQWRERNNVFTKVIKFTKDSFGVCRNIYTVKVKNQPHYLPVISFLDWNEQATQFVTAFRINANSLDSVQLFKNKETRLNRIEYPISLGNMMKDSLRFINITYDDKQNKLYVPLTDEYGMFTKQYSIYELKGDYLEFTSVGELKLEKPMPAPGK